MFNNNCAVILIVFLAKVYNIKPWFFSKISDVNRRNLKQICYDGMEEERFCFIQNANSFINKRLQVNFEIVTEYYVLEQHVSYID